MMPMRSPRLTDRLTSSKTVTARMDRLLELTRIAPVKGGPASAEHLREMKVRVATHLERFRSETERKIVALSSR